MLNLGPELQDQVETLAKRSGVTKGEVVRHALRLYLELERLVEDGAEIRAVTTESTSKTLMPLTLNGRPKKPKKK